MLPLDEVFLAEGKALRKDRETQGLLDISELL